MLEVFTASAAGIIGQVDIQSMAVEISDIWVSNELDYTLADKGHRHADRGECLTKASIKWSELLNTKPSDNFRDMEMS